MRRFIEIVGLLKPFQFIQSDHLVNKTLDLRYSDVPWYIVHSFSTFYMARVCIRVNGKLSLISNCYNKKCLSSYLHFLVSILFPHSSLNSKTHSIWCAVNFNQFKCEFEVTYKWGKGKSEDQSCGVLFVNQLNVIISVFILSSANP